MAAKTIHKALDVSSAQPGEQKTVFLMANLCAWLFRQGGGHIRCSSSSAALVKCGDSAKTGLLAAAYDLRELILKVPYGREALRDLGFEPLLERFEGNEQEVGR